VVVIKKDKREEKERLRQQKQDNDYIMGGSLGSALIYVVGKKLGWGRSLMDVCDSFNPQDDDEEKNDEKQQVKKKKKKKRLLIKPKHCCRAMNEVKVIFPHLFQNAAAVAAAAGGVTSLAIVPDVTTSSSSSTAMAHVKQEEGTTVSSPPPPPPSSNTIMTTSNQMTQHSIRNLSLPPITQNMICILTHHILTEQRTKGRDSGIKPNVIVGGVTYMICSAGLIMERLAKQACSSSSSGARNGWKKNGVLIQSKRKLEEKEMEVNDSKKQRKQEDPNETTTTVNPQQQEDTKRPAEEKLLAGRADDTTDVLPPLLQPTLEGVDDILLSSSSTTTATTSFDVLSHKPINQNIGKSASSYTTAQEQDELHSWEAWKHHFSTSSSSSWHRSLPHIAKQLKISKHSLYDYYRKSIFKRRLELLQSLRNYEREEEEEQEEEKWMRKSMMAAAPLMTLPSKG